MALKKLFEKIRFERYLSVYIILMIDIAMSVFASMLTLITENLLFIKHGVFSGAFVAQWLLTGTVAICAFFYIFKTYYAVIRHTGLREIWRLAAAVTGKGVVMTLVMALCPVVHYSFTHYAALLILDWLYTMVVLVLVRVAMLLVYDYIRSKSRDARSLETILIYGTDDKAISFVQTMQESAKYNVAGFLVFGDTTQHHVIVGKHVYCVESEREFAAVVNARQVDAIIFAHRNDARLEENRLIRYCISRHIKVLYSPSVEEVVNGKVNTGGVRSIKIEDLLGRPEIKISLEQIRSYFQGKTVMVTGGAGSIGSELCRQLANFGVRNLVLYDNAETPMHNIRLEMEERFPQLDFVPVIGDVRHTPRLDFVFRTHHPQVVFHAAAYKHVPLMEENPCEAVLVNVAGSRNVADKCIEYGVEKMVMISTDKAVNPTNIMGCTKRLAEIYVQSLGLALESCPESLGIKSGQPVTKFVTTRFGNVLGSNGSVIPRFRDQIAQGGPVTVTHRDITRFFMTIPEACRLVMEAATMTCGNQIFVFDMGESVKIDHLARRMIELAGLVPDRDIKIAYTGLRPGEKLYEEVLSSAENTQPTQHDRIRIAQVREYDYADAVKAVDNLERLSRDVRIIEMVKYMKAIVPEYKSQNSQFEKLDTNK